MHAIIYRAIIFSTVCLFTVLPAATQTAAPAVSASQIDALFADFTKPGSPGCALSLVRNGKVAYQKGYGAANLDYDIAITPASVFYIASDSKQFTAFSIALLINQRKVALTDSVTKYLPELPRDVYGPVTIGHLIYHSSGVRDYWGLQEIAGKRTEEPLSQDDFLKLMAQQKELNFKPGDQFMYSNSGYALLAIVVKRASGKDLPEFAAENIFRPLGMKSTSFGANHLAVLKNRAVGYHLRDGMYEMDGGALEPLGDGGLRTTVEDLSLWDQNFYHNKLGNSSPELIQLVETPGKLANGRPSAYAFGLAVVKYHDFKMITHTGAAFGYLSYMARLPEQNLSVACLCNSDGPQFLPWALSRKVLDLYLPSQPNANPPATASVSEPAKTNPPAEAAPMQLSEQELARYTGTFRENDGTMWKLVVNGGKLEAHVEGITFALQPVNSSHFRAVGAPQSVDLYFSAAGQSDSKNIGLQVGTQPRSELKPFTPPTLSAAELAAYAGEYSSDELDVTVKVSASGGHLTLKREHSEPEVLDPSPDPKSKDEFKKGRRALKFGRGPTGAISDFRLEGEGVTGVRFVKKP